MHDEQFAAALAGLTRELVGRGRVIAPGSLGVSWGVRPGEDSSLFYGASADAYLPGSSQLLAKGSGKGQSPEEAMLRALAEGFERYVSALVRVDVHASAQQLEQSRRRWLDPRAVAPVTDRQYARLPHLQPFTEHQILQWVQGHSLNSAEPVLVPVDLVFWPGDTSPWNRDPIIDATTSGIAAHRSKPDAIQHALRELIERHALTVNWFERRSPTRIATSALGDAWARRVAHWQQHRRRVDVLDLSRYGRGAVVVVVTISSTEYPCLSVGAGASLDRFGQALTQAFREAEVCLDLMTRYRPPAPIRPEDVRGADDHAYLYAFGGHRERLRWLYDGPVTTEVPHPQTSARQLLAELNPIVVALAPLHDQVGRLLADLTPEMRELIRNASLHAVRVICPDLVPIHFGHGNGHYTHPAVYTIAPQNKDFPHYFA